MNIDLWLEKALKKVQSTDPNEVLKKLEKYGLVEASQDSEVAEEKTLARYSIVSEGSKEEHYYDLPCFYETATSVSAYQIHDETEFTVAPHEAAHYLSMTMMISSDFLSPNIFSQAA